MSWNSTASWSLDLEFMWPSGGKGHMISLPSGLIGSHYWQKRYSEVFVTVRVSCSYLLSFVVVSLAHIFKVFFYHLQSTFTCPVLIA